MILFQSISNYNARITSNHIDNYAQYVYNGTRNGGVENERRILYQGFH